MSDGNADTRDFPAASASSNVGGMGSHWACCCPRPSGTERIDCISTGDLDRAFLQAERLLDVSAARFDTPVNGYVRDTLGSVFDPGRANGSGRAVDAGCGISQRRHTGPARPRGDSAGCLRAATNQRDAASEHQGAASARRTGASGGRRVGGRRHRTGRDHARAVGCRGRGCPTHTPTPVRLRDQATSAGAPSQRARHVGDDGRTHRNRPRAHRGRPKVGTRCRMGRLQVPGTA